MWINKAKRACIKNIFSLVTPTRSEGRQAIDYARAQYSRQLLRTRRFAFFPQTLPVLRVLGLGPRARPLHVTAVNTENQELRDRVRVKALCSLHFTYKSKMNGGWLAGWLGPSPILQPGIYRDLRVCFSPHSASSQPAQDKKCDR